MPIEEQINASIEEIGRKQTLIKFIEKNNKNILNPEISGFDVVHERTAIYDAILKDWFLEIVNDTSVAYEFALIAHGGMGRREMVPNSDFDFELVANSLISEEDPLIRRYVLEVHTKLEKMFNSPLISMVHNFSDIISFSGKSLNTFFDARAIYGSEEFVKEIRKKIREHYDPIDLFLHNIALWQKTNENNPNSIDIIEEFDTKKGVGGLRNFQAGVSLLASQNFTPLVEIYETIPKEVLESYSYMLKTRARINLIKNINGKEADKIKYDDLILMENEEREKLFDARRKIERFTKKIINERKNLRNGLVYSPNQLGFADDFIEKDNDEKNKILFNLLQTSQVRGIPIDQSEYRTNLNDVEKWARPNKWLAQLFYDRGSLAETLEKLREVNIQIISGFSKLEISIPDKDEILKSKTKGGLALATIHNLEELVKIENEELLAKEYHQLDANYQAAIKLALLVEKIPHVDENMRGIIDTSLSDYLSRLGKDYSFNQDSLNTCEFLVKNRRLFFNLTRHLNDPSHVQRLKDICKDKDHLRSLYIFTNTDFINERGSNNHHIILNIDELYQKCMNSFTGIDDLIPSNFYYSQKAEKELLDDLGPDFGSSRYAELAPTYTYYLNEVNEKGKPIVKLSNIKGHPHLIVACKDYPGLISVITGKCLESDINIKQAHAYTLSRNKMALDFFSLDFSNSPSISFLEKITESIDNKELIDIEPSQILQGFPRKTTLDFLKDSGFFGLSVESKHDKKGVLYALSRFIFDNLEGNIYGMNSFVDWKGQSINDIFFNTTKSHDYVFNTIKKIH